MSSDSRVRAWETRKRLYGSSGSKKPAKLLRGDEKIPWVWLRMQLGMSQLALADALGLVRNHVYLWENGTHLPSLPYFVALVRMAKAQGLDKSFIARTLAYVGEKSDGHDV